MSYFHRPRFQHGVSGRVSYLMEDNSSNDHAVRLGDYTGTKKWHEFASIATEGFSATNVAIHTFACRLKKPVFRKGFAFHLRCGFTDQTVCTDVNKNSVMLDLDSGSLVKKCSEYFETDFTKNEVRHASEVVCFLRIEEDDFSQKMIYKVQFIVDGHRCASIDCSEVFNESPYRIFPCVIVGGTMGSEIEAIHYHQLENIDDLVDGEKEGWMKANSVDLHERNRLLYEKLEQELRNAIAEKNEEISRLKVLLERKDEQLDEERRKFQVNSNQEKLTSDLQKEKEEHEKTKQKLHQAEIEMKSMEVFFLKQQNQFFLQQQQNQMMMESSGQRRLREEPLPTQPQQQMMMNNNNNNANLRSNTIAPSPVPHQPTSSTSSGLPLQQPQYNNPNNNGGQSGGVYRGY